MFSPRQTTDGVVYSDGKMLPPSWAQLTKFAYINHNVMYMLGEFEYLILSSAARLGDEAYGASIRGEIENATGRPCSIGALYTTLDRLEEKGFVKTWMGSPTPQRGGRSKRLVRVTGNGAKGASEFLRAISNISQGVSWARNHITSR